MKFRIVEKQGGCSYNGQIYYEIQKSKRGIIWTTYGRYTDGGAIGVFDSYTYTSIKQAEDKVVELKQEYKQCNSKVKRKIVKIIEE
jgi:hypothetical protein